jgi:hypothetical protein
LDIKYRNITVRAGRAARKLIKESGFNWDMVDVMAGASGGPKWLVLSGLDRLIFPRFRKRKRPLFLLGSSIGSWRFAASSCPDFEKAYGAFEDSYLMQSYSAKPSPGDVTDEAVKIMDAFFGDKASGCLVHPYLRLNILSVRCRGIAASENKLLMGAGVAAAAALNAASRKSLGFFFERALFYDPRDIPPFFNMTDFPISRIPLDPGNIRDAVLSSGSIPLVMSGISGIKGAAPGTYRDGGIIDYNLDVPFSTGNGRLVFYPHYSERVVPGWFDKNLGWRRPSPVNYDSVVMVSPSAFFVSNLPYGKVPDRKDFRMFAGRDDDRISYWRTVLGESARLADEFFDAVRTGRLADISGTFE